MTTTGLSIKGLPATFRDAITVTSRLGLEFIWIDALCIIQLDAEDWGLHSVTMAKVYPYSAITLAAAASSDAHGGLFRERNPVGIDGVKLDTEKTVTDEEMLLYVWAPVVAQYSVGKLSKESDMLIAIDGVAQQLTSIVPRKRYLNGLWSQESLPLSLLWRTETEDEPPSIRVAPSWSPSLGWSRKSSTSPPPTMSQKALRCRVQRH
ncbi:hypothetical protein F52700_632 [Fusarium sp. NRRL 52700]|nr:hypothetical protein F52700_632 [Fusarium sp. NRRL 52700]